MKNALIATYFACFPMVSFGQDFRFGSEILEAEAVDVSLSKARSAAQKDRDVLLEQARERCSAMGGIFEILSKSTIHRQSGFQFLAHSRAQVACR